MTSQMDSTWTAVKVRGKKHGTRNEKAYSGVRRKLRLRKPQNALSSLYATSTRPLSQSRKRKRQADGEQSRLEQLPAEVVQQIFEYSGNIALPLVSQEIALKLSGSQHLRLQLATLHLRPILGHTEGRAVTSDDLSKATRLLSCRFMTWDFFVGWLESLPEAASFLDDPSEDATDIKWNHFWLHLSPAPELLPPRKLLSPPFTPEKIRFLQVLIQQIQDIASMSPAYENVAQEGLNAAVEQGNASAVTVLSGMGIQGSTELLRVAVADAGCHEDIVRTIVERSQYDTTKSKMDLLDPVVWSWAEREKASGNGKGEWLLEFLKSMQDLDYENEKSEGRHVVE